MRYRAITHIIVPPGSLVEFPDGFDVGGLPGVGGLEVVDEIVPVSGSGGTANPEAKGSKAKPVKAKGADAGQGSE